MSLRTEAHCHQNTMNVLFSTTDVCCTGRIFLLSLEYFRPNAQNRCFDRSLRNPFILLRPNPPVIHWCPRMPVVNRLFGQTRNSSHSLFCPVGCGWTKILLSFVSRSVPTLSLAPSHVPRFLSPSDHFITDNVSLIPS